MAQYQYQVGSVAEARALDAADGVMDGRYYGTPIQGLTQNPGSPGQWTVYGSTYGQSQPAYGGSQPPVYGQSTPAYGASQPPPLHSSIPPPTGPGSNPAGATSVIGSASIPPTLDGDKKGFNDSPGLPQWSGSNVRPLEASMVPELRKFNISEACQNSVTQGVKLLNDLGEAWQSDYAIIFSKQSHTWWLLAREKCPLGLAEAVEAHKRIAPAASAKGKDPKRTKEARKAFPLEKRLMSKIVGQHQAILAVSQQIRRKENGWHSSEHPLVFLFLGSSGIGKTELAKQVAWYMHEDDKDGFIRLDMSEYQHQHEVSKFIGAPPGYQGYDDGGQLTKRLKRCPNAVVLFDEVEKAHPDILTCLLQTFDEGRLTDGKGETVDCMDAIFVMTSNLAQREIADEAVQRRAEMARRGELEHDGGTPLISADFAQKTIMPVLKHAFRRDEFIGRINEILFFLPFTLEQRLLLAKKEVEKWAAIARKRHNMVLEWGPELEDFLIKSYDLRFGVRSIQHEVGRQVVSKLAAAHEDDAIGEGDTIILGVGDNEVTLRKGARKNDKAPEKH